MSLPLLTARWVNLLIPSYFVAPEMLGPFLPRGLEPDLIDGKAVVSLVAFQFLDTRLFGIRWPGFVNFPELNLRFYARRLEEPRRRGVVFVRELAPSRLIAFMARALYDEPYYPAPLKVRLVRDPHSVHIRYSLAMNGCEHTLEARASATTRPAADGSVESWLTHQQWGFGRDRRGRTLRYLVEHPSWELHENVQADIHLDWNRLYGRHWATLNGVQPFSTLLVTGSEVTVERAQVDGVADRSEAAIWPNTRRFAPPVLFA